MTNYTEEYLIQRFSEIKTRLDLVKFEIEIEDNSFQFSKEDYHIIKQAISGKRNRMDELFYSILNA
jgi:hypothetical protein